MTLRAPRRSGLLRGAAAAAVVAAVVAAWAVRRPPRESAPANAPVVREVMAPLRPVKLAAGVERPASPEPPPEAAGDDAGAVPAGATRITVAVTRDDGSAAAGVPVVAATVSSRREQNAGANGETTFEAIAGCPILLTAASCTGHVQARIDACGSPARVALRLRRGFDFVGQVVDEAGAPVANAEVRASPVPEPRVLRDPACDAAIKSDAAGRFRLPEREAVPHVVVARAEGRLDAEARGAIPGRGELRLVLRNGRALRGRVVDAASRPVTKFSLRVTRAHEAEASIERAFTDPDGRFTLTPVAPGAYDVVATTDAGGGTAHAVVGADADAELTIVAQARKSVEGRLVSFSTHQPLADVGLKLACGPRALTTKSAADGSFRFDGAPAGACTFGFEQEDGGALVPTSRFVDLSAGTAGASLGDVVIVEAKVPEDGDDKRAGMGAVVRLTNGRLTIGGVRAGSPADLAGLNPGDVIESVDGLALDELGLRPTVYLLKGSPGSTANLVIRAPSGNVRAISLQRAAL